MDLSFSLLATQSIIAIYAVQIKPNLDKCAKDSVLSKLAENIGSPFKIRSYIRQDIAL